MNRWSKTALPGAAWSVAIGIAVLYVIGLCRYSALLFQDYPNHLARACVLADLWFHRGAHFGAAFEFHGIAYPYIVADFLLAPLVQLLGPQGATFAWTALAVLSLPCAMLYYLRATTAPVASRVFIFLIALYLSTDAFFFVGFINFRFSIALTLVALALAQLLRHRYSPTLFAIYCLTVAFGYLMHLAFLVFALVGIGTCGLFRLWRRGTTLRRECILLLPLVASGFWYVISGWLYPITREVIPAHFVRDGLRTKLRQLDWPLIRFNESVDLLFTAAFALLLLMAVRRQLRWAVVGRVHTWEPALLALAFVGLYLALPASVGDPTYIDLRAVPWLPIFAAIWCTSLFTDSSAVNDMGSRVALTGVAVLLVANLGYMCANLSSERAWLWQYRAVLTHIPRSALVLPIYTGVRTPTRRPFLDANAFVVIDRQGVEPYLFSGDQGQPMKYFRYRNRPYAPDKLWYSLTPPRAVDWPAVACTYNFLLVVNPYNAARIGLPTTMIAKNSSATLLAPDRAACRGH
ncbi:MAG TPA: hypothetical protein VIY90_02705 [Steroidobacteraceae bacterium]